MRKTIKKSLLVIVACTLLATPLTSCIGSFALTHKIKAWNDQVGSKFANQLTFILLAAPVYLPCLAIDALVINSIEFWSGNNPVGTPMSQVIDGKDARYRVERDATGYTVKNLNDGSQFRFNHNDMDDSWSLEQDGQSVKFMQYIDDTHVKMLTPTGTWEDVELSADGVLAYRQALAAQTLWLAQAHD